VGLDRFVGVDRLVTEGDIDVLVTGDYLGDMGWQAAQDLTFRTSAR
jgi:hypothetical protein